MTNGIGFRGKTMFRAYFAVGRWEFAVDSRWRDGMRVATLRAWLRIVYPVP